MAFEFKENKSRITHFLSGAFSENKLLQHTQGNTNIKRTADICRQILTLTLSNDNVANLCDDKYQITSQNEHGGFNSIIGLAVVNESVIVELFWILALMIRGAYFSSGLAERPIIEGIHAQICDAVSRINLRQDQIQYFLNKSPIDALCKNQEKHLKEMDEKLIQVDSNIEILDEKIKTTEELIKKIEEKLDYLNDHNLKLNFSVLSSQINELVNNKRKEMNKQKLSTIFFGFLMLLPVVLLAYFELKYTIISSSTKNFDYSYSIIMLSKIFPFATLEVIFIYFFRIALQGYVSTKRQLLQLIYRATVARFTNEYVKFVKDHDQGDKSDHLVKFESLIYSEINFDDKNIPSPYDMLKLILSEKNIK